MEAKITIDAHSLFWYVDKDFNDKLSPLALQLITEAESNGTIYVPVIVLMEIAHLIERGRINISFNNLMSHIEGSQSYHIVPIDAVLLKIAISISGLEIHDRLILATAIITNSTLVSKDRAVRGIGRVNVIW